MVLITKIYSSTNSSKTKQIQYFIVTKHLNAKEEIIKKHQ